MPTSETDNNYRLSPFIKQIFGLMMSYGLLAVYGLIAWLLFTTHGQAQDITEFKVGSANLQSNIARINNNIDKNNFKINTLQGDLNTLQGDLNTLQGDLNTLQNAVNNGFQNIAELIRENQQTQLPLGYVQPNVTQQEFGDITAQEFEELWKWYTQQRTEEDEQIM